MDTARIRQELDALGLDGWLLYDFKGLNTIARDVLALGGRMLTRRWFCLVRRAGEPIFLGHEIERCELEGRVPGELRTYSGRTQLEERLREMIGAASPPGSAPRLAMEYSPKGAIPTASRVDAGTVELVRSLGAEVVSSAGLVQAVAARWPARGLALHREAALTLTDAVREAFRFIALKLKTGGATTEVEVQRVLLDRMERGRLVAEASVPNVSANARSADPHYQPTAERHEPIRRGDFVLIDVWGKHRGDPDGVYGDITWVGVAGETVPAKVAQVFDVVVGGRDRALALVQTRLGAGGDGDVRGFEVDRAARDFIEAAGYGAYFVHRTGHSLGPDDHWIGANMDDFETKDERRLIPETGFTIEPGVYLPGDFGVRSEIDIYVHPTGPEVTTPPQRAVVPILGSWAGTGL